MQAIVLLAMLLLPFYETVNYKADNKVVTAYTSSRRETDKTPCISANGTNICKLFNYGYKSCAANKYVFGTVLHVSGYGKCIVLDRTAYKYKDRIDVYMGNNRKWAKEWGKRKVKVFVVPIQRIDSKSLLALKEL